MNTTIQTKLLSSLEKVFPAVTPTSNLTSPCSIFKNEAFSFQVAYTTEATNLDSPYFLSIEVDSPLQEYIAVKSVGLVPSQLAAPPECDSDFISTEPGLYPDVLYPLESMKIKLVNKQWDSLWIEVKSSTTLPHGEYPITINFKNTNSQVIASETLTLTVLNTNLPKQTLIHTQWFHTDCISNFYDVDIFSDRYWELLEKFILTATDHGINMILTPLFTPPLDTEVGGERRTVQLVDVTLENGTYYFDFANLDRWVDICKRSNVEYFEMSHLFTQWGAHATPKVMATVDGEYKRIFGWDVPALDESYKKFLESFLPALVEFLKSREIDKVCYFHISDEPSLEQAESYGRAKELVKDLLAGFPIIDALSDLEFYKNGLINHPIPSNDHIHSFIEAGVPNLWTYYCCAQYRGVSNRFMAMPSYRNRIIATQLFKYDIKGFLHWGYNFWNTQYSKQAINPFEITDAGAAFSSGDSFLVYPGENEPIESIRLKVFTEALYDLRAMQMLADLTSKEYVLNLIEQDLSLPITFTHYPRSQDYILNLRSTINAHIAKYL